LRRIPQESPPTSPPWWMLEARPDPFSPPKRAESLFIKFIKASPVTMAIILLNLLVYLVFVQASSSLRGFSYENLALIPAAVTGLSLFRPQVGSFTTIFTHMFLHGNLLHIFINMFVLFQFGPFVEMRLGKLRYLAFYLLGGVLAGLIQVVVTPASPVPAVGASGAIAAVIGAFIYLYPHSRLYLFFLIPMSSFTLAIIFTLFTLALIGSPFYLGGVELSLGLANGAHLGGFAFGYIGFFALGLRMKKLAEPLTLEDVLRRL